MKKNLLVFVFLLGITIITWTPAAAQVSAPFVKAATFFLSVDGWTSIWWNGAPITTQYPSLTSKTGPVTLEETASQLCNFQRENVLAIEVTEPVNASSDGSAGIGYILTLSLSDDTKLIFTSNDSDEHVSDYLGDRTVKEPTGWELPRFDDSRWPRAYHTGLPFSSFLTDPRTDQNVQYLAGYDIKNFPPKPGERHLFRRRLSLDISLYSGCPTPTTPSVPYTAVRTPPKPLIQEGTWAGGQRPVRGILGTSPDAALVPLPTLGVKAEQSQTQAVTFDSGYANIYASFADGEGTYQLEVVDGQGKHVKNLYKKRLVSSREMWLKWDGTNEEGSSMPAGRYIVLYSKDGKELARIFVIRKP